MHAAVREIKNLDKTGKMSGMTERATPTDDSVAVYEGDVMPTEASPNDNSAIARAIETWYSAYYPLGVRLRHQERTALAKYVANHVQERLTQALGCNHRFDPECARCEWSEPIKQALERGGLLPPNRTSAAVDER